MGQSAILFVTVKTEKSNEVYEEVKKAIDKWQRNLLDEYWRSKGFESRLEFQHRDKELGCNKDLKDWTNGVYSCDTYDFRSFNMHFKVNAEQRSLFCTHTCSCDYSDTYEGDKIIFSIGCWGMSDEIMKVVGEACKPFGDVYYDFNDCDDENFIKL